jgi:hypothetical protein
LFAKERRRTDYFAPHTTVKNFAIFFRVLKKLILKNLQKVFLIGTEIVSSFHCPINGLRIGLDRSGAK